MHQPVSLAVTNFNVTQNARPHTGNPLVSLIWGAEGYESQRDVLQKRVDIIIGIPGRLLTTQTKIYFRLEGYTSSCTRRTLTVCDVRLYKRYPFFNRMPNDWKDSMYSLFAPTLSISVLDAELPMTMEWLQLNLNWARTQTASE